MSDDRDWIDELYDEGRDEAPPPALDAAILAAARDNAARPWYRNIRKLTTVATAASFVLAAMIVYYAPEDGGRSESAAKLERREAAERSARETAVPASPPARKATVPPAEPASSQAEPAPEPEPGPPRVEGPADMAVEEALAPSAATPNTTGAAEGTTDTGRSASAADAAAATERTLSSRAQTAKFRAEPASLNDALSAMTGRCGPPPGTEQSRTLEQDALGWYLTVTSADAVTYYRCVDDAWRVIDGPVREASEQQPDPEDDQ